MRRSRKEKQDTHDKILTIAARRFREKGFQGVSVADIMSEAGLTHGGFYKHFKSRDALVVEALQKMIEGSRKDLTGAMDDNAATGVEAYINSYLSERHFSDPGDACPVATIATEVARTPAAQDTFSAFFDRYSNLIGSMMDEDDDNRQMKGAAIICAAAGAFSVARSLKDKEKATALLDTMREILLDVVKK